MRIAVVVTWAALAVVGVSRVRDRTSAAVLAGGALMALLLAGVRWRSVLASPIGDVVVLAWASVAVAVITFAGDLGFGEPSTAAYLVVVVFATLLLSRRGGAWIVPTAAVAGVVLSDVRTPDGLGADSLLSVIVLVGAGAAAAAVAGGWEDRERREAGQLRELRRREEALLRRQAELERLYAVARSIGAGRSLTEVVPILLRRVAESVGAGAGMVFVYRSSRSALELLTPLWLESAVEQRVGTRYLPLTEGGAPQRVFLHGTPGTASVHGDSPGAWGRLAAELGIGDFIAVPLQMPEGRLGVLLVYDGPSGRFSERDVAVVEDLAAPATLVLDHITRFQEARERSERMAELAKLKSDFVSVVSHELRTPLTSIMGVLQTVTRPELAPENPDVRDLLEAGVSQADRLKELIDDLLVVSQIDNRAVSVRPSSVEVAAIVRTAVAGVAGAEQLVTARIPPDLPEVMIDAGLLGRVLANLIGNAVKYGDGSSIELTASAEGGELTLSVADHGPGLPGELSGRAFEPFTQLRRAEVAGRGGIGLGLAICRGLVEAMGGTIGYEPTTGGGATFTVRIPLKPKAVHPAGHSSPGVPVS